MNKLIFQILSHLQEGQKIIAWDNLPSHSQLIKVQGVMRRAGELVLLKADGHCMGFNSIDRSRLINYFQRIQSFY